MQSLRSRAVALFVVFACCRAGAAFSGDQANTVTSSADLPIAASTFVPCAAGGSGDVVDLSGRLHSLFHVTRNADGGTTVVAEFNPQGVSGSGESTGTMYRGTGSTTIVSTSHDGTSQVQTFIDNFRIIGAGPGNNFMVHVTLHTTVDSGLAVAAQVDNISVDCR